MNFKISIFLISLILFIGCGDDEDSLSNDIDFFSNHAGTIWYTNGFWLRINNDSSDDYYNGKCVRFPVADGTYNSFFGDVQFNQTINRNEANFVSWTLQYIGENPDYTDGTLSYSVDASGNKLTVTYPAGGGYTYTKVNDTFPGTDCKN